MANCFYKAKEVRSRSNRDREVKLSYTHTVTLIYSHLKHADINFRVTDSVANLYVNYLLITKELTLKEGQLCLFLVTSVIVSPPRVWC